MHSHLYKYRNVHIDTKSSRTTMIRSKLRNKFLKEESVISRRADTKQINYWKKLKDNISLI